MADASNPTPPSGSSAGATEEFARFIAKLSFEVDPVKSQEIQKALTPLQKFMKDFSQTTDVKHTFFGQLPGIKKALNDIMPDSMRFANTMINTGLASLNGADNLEFYNNNLGILGKGLVQVSRLFNYTGETATMMGASMQAACIAGTLGIAAVVVVLVQLLQLLGNTVKIGFQWQDRLNEFNKILGGLSRGALADFNRQLNASIKGLNAYGFSLSEIIGSTQAYISSGLSPLISMQHTLLESTLQLSEITGESSSALSTFFSGIMRGSKVSGENIKTLGNSWTAFNKVIVNSGVLGVASFEDVKEAISSVGTALLIASNKGNVFTDNLSRDLIALTSLSKNLNISVSELNAKFEEAGNLVTSQDSPFRALLAISGGANVTNMLNNQFNRTDAMLKVVTTLKTLTTQFGGNLNVMSQVAAQAFGLSKEMAIKLATMSTEQQTALRQAQEDSKKLQTDSMKKSWESVTGTLTSQFERFKNIMVTAIQTAFAGNDGVNGFITKITTTLQRWMNDLSNPSSGFSKLIARVSDIIQIIFTKFGEWFDNLIPILESVKTTLDEFFSAVSGKGGFWRTLGTLLFEALKLPVIMLSRLFAATIKSEFAGIFGGLVGLAFGPIVAVIGYFAGKFLGKNPVLEAIEKNTDPDNPKQASMATKLSETLSKALSQNQREQQKLNGIADTDLIVGKDGNFTLAGLEKLDLQDEEAKLKQQQLDAQTENTAAVINLTEVLREQQRAKSGYNSTYGYRDAGVGSPQMGVVAARAAYSYVGGTYSGPVNLAYNQQNHG